MVEVWFDRQAPGYDPFRSQMDDHIWVDAFSDVDTYVFAGWLIGIRPPDTLVIMVQGLPRRDQRRQHVHEIVDLPAQMVVAVDVQGEPIGEKQLAKIHDLSGGGVKMELHEHVEKNDLLMLYLEIGEVQFDAVVAVIDAFRTIQGRQFVRCAFVEIEERFRREVIRYVFREQLRKSRLMGSA
jgi:c-di-GMP-binding flagellar brake protein YcgR